MITHTRKCRYCNKNVQVTVYYEDIGGAPTEVENHYDCICGYNEDYAYGSYDCHLRMTKEEVDKISAYMSKEKDYTDCKHLNAGPEGLFCEINDYKQCSAFTKSLSRKKSNVSSRL